MVVVVCLGLAGGTITIYPVSTATIVIRRFIDVVVVKSQSALFPEMRVFVEYRKRSVEFDVEETMTIGEFKNAVEKLCRKRIVLFTG